MKKILLALPFALILSGCGSDVDLVKDGVMDFNQTTTLGQALDNWKSCKETNWEFFETDNGVTVVQFTCNHKVSDFIAKAKSFLSKKDLEEAPYLDILSSVDTFQFTLNQDDSFQIDNVQVETAWEDGTKINDSRDSIERLETAYENELTFNINLLQNKLAAEQVAMSFRMVKMQAK